MTPPAKGGRTTARAASKKKAGPSTDARSFPDALAALLRTRGIRVPPGLKDAPPDAYAHQTAAFADQLAGSSDADLKRFAEKIAGHTKRQAERARTAWESSPLIAELRRRKLREPVVPTRVVGASVSLRKPLKEWTDAEIVHAAKQWSTIAR